MRGSLERDISSLRALGPGGVQISRDVHVSTRAAFGVFAEKYGFVQEGHTFLEKRREEREERRERREKREEARPDHRFLVLFTNMFEMLDFGILVRFS